MKNPIPLPILLAMLGVLSIAGGCSVLEPQPDPSRFFVLGDATARPPQVDLNCDQRLLVGPVTIAGHLENARIARRVESSEIVYAEWSFWGEPLQRSLPRELMFSLEQAMPDTCVFDYRSTTPADGDVQIQIGVDQFELTAKDSVVVAVNWTLSVQGKPERHRGGVWFEEQVDDPTRGVAAGVTALNDVLRKVAGSIAVDVNALRNLQ